MAISFDQGKHIFKLRTNRSDYILQILDSGLISHLYYGKPVSDFDVGYIDQRRGVSFSPTPADDADGNHSLDLIGLEYPCAGVSDYREPCLQVLDAAGGPA